MKINQCFKENELVKSFEIFPHNNKLPFKSIIKVVADLVQYNPAFISVTCGASGYEQTTQTIDAASLIKNQFNTEVMVHLTCVAASQDKILGTLNAMKANDIENVLALKGDIPKDFNDEMKRDFYYGADLVDFIVKSKKNDFSIAAACYPEGHFETVSEEQDIEHLKNKVEKGVDFLVTQLFFDNNNYFSFHQKIRDKGIDTPVSIGLMPAVNAKLIKKIIGMCGAKIPSDLEKLLVKYEGDEPSMFAAGIDYACKQIEGLVAYGIEGLHIYSLNRPEVVNAIYKNMNW
ncbi:MAG: methylenetetrahydrofolate reductase [Thermotaleaceae bacterium]